MTVAVHVKGTAEGREKRLREMLARPSDFRRVCAAIEALVIASLREELASKTILMPSDVRVPSRAELKRRVDYCVEVFAILRFDCHYSTVRALDELPKALRAMLEGRTWEPADPFARATWAKRDGEQMVVDEVISR